MPYNNQPNLIIGCGHSHSGYNKPLEAPIDGIPPSQTHFEGVHACNIALAIRLGNSELGRKIALEVNPPLPPAAQWVRNSFFPFGAFPILDTEAYTIDANAALNPDTVGSWLAAPAPAEYLKMAGKLQLIYFENIPLNWGAPQPGEASQIDVFTILVKALKPGGIMIIRSIGVEDHLDTLEGYLQRVTADLVKYPNDNEAAGGEKPYFVYRSPSKGFCEDVRIVKRK